jgi:hypothetical protein
MSAFTVSGRDLTASSVTELDVMQSARVVRIDGSSARRTPPPVEADLPDVQAFVDFLPALGTTWLDAVSLGLGVLDALRMRRVPSVAIEATERAAAARAHERPRRPRLTW